VASGVSALGYTDTGLTNRTTYYYVVSAVTSGSTESTNSSQVAATPMPSDTWLGASADANWQTSGNWVELPAAGDPLFFDGSLQLSNTNNYANGTQFGGITFNSTAGAFTLNGSAINLTGNIVNNSGTAQTVTLGISLTGTSPTVNTATGDVIVAGSISQSGGIYGLTKTGTGSLTLSGTNTFGGGLILYSGVVGAESNSALGTGTLTLAGGTLRNAMGSGKTRVLGNSVFVLAETTSSVRAVAADLVLSGRLTGSGTLDLSGVYNAAGMRLSGSNAGFTGTVRVSGPNVRLDTPDSGSANAAWIVGVSGTGGLQLNTSGTANTFQLGSLSGNGCTANSLSPLLSSRR
jgi:autotransporter-associated beta strand protein